MQRNILITIVLLLAAWHLQAQDAQVLIDSLKRELTRNPDQKRRANIYSDLGWYYSNISIDSALHYGRKAEAGARTLGDSIMLAQVYSDLGAVHFRNGDFNSSEESYLKAYRIRKAKKDVSGLAKINANLASIYTSRQKYPQAMKAFLEALNYFESVNNLPVANAIKTNIGMVFQEMKNYPKAVKYTSEAIQYEERNKLTAQLCTSYLNLGNIYLNMHDTITAMKLYQKSLAACKATSNKKGIASVLNNIGTIRSGQKKAADAAALYAQSAAMRKGFNVQLDEASLKLNIAKEHLNKKEYAKARDVLLQIRKVFEEKDSQNDLMITYSLLIPAYAYLNVPDSTTYYAERYAQLKETLLQEEALKNTAELETRYETEKKEKQLLIEQAEVRRKNILLIASLSLVAVVALIGYLIYRQQRLKNKQQQQEFQLKSAIAQIEAQNKLQEQRLTISRDLHDNIGAQLTFIISSVDNIKHAFDIGNEKLSNKLSYISEFTKSTIIELRDTIWAMNNHDIHFEDLRARILNFTEKARMAREDIEFRFSIGESIQNVSLSSISGMNIYRSIQEAVNNAIKYSNASNIGIRAFETGDKIEIVISDDGKGFDIGQVEKGNGLMNMAKRIEDIGGEFEINSAPGVGTKVTIRIDKHQEPLNPTT